MNQNSPDTRRSPGAPRHLRQRALLAWLRLARVFQHVERISERHFRAHGLSSAQFDVLAQIGAAEGLSQQELARSLFVTKGNISQLLKRMEQQGFVERSQSGRSNMLWLTAAGRHLYATVVPAQEALIAQLFGALTPDEQHNLIGLLRKLDRELRQAAPALPADGPGEPGEGDL